MPAYLALSTRVKIGELGFQRFELGKFPDQNRREIGSFSIAQAVFRTRIFFARRHHVNLEFGRRGEGICERLQEEGQSPRYNSPVNEVAQPFFNYCANYAFCQRRLAFSSARPNKFALPNRFQSIVSKVLFAITPNLDDAAAVR